MTHDDELFEDYHPPADRFLLAQTWWIASELVRRHPHLRISTVQTPELAQLVIVHDEPDGYRVQFDLVGGAKFMVGDVLHSISWVEMMAAAGPHDIVKRIERDSGLGVPKATPESTPRALVYRVIAAALAVGVDSRHDWYAEEVAIDLETDASEHPLLSRFPSADDAVVGYQQEILLRTGASERGAIVFYQPLIALMRDHVPAVVFDLAGVAHTLDGAKQLMPMYRGIHSNLTLTMAQVVGPWLP